MKKIITIILIAIIVIPFFPGKEVHASATKDEKTPGKINNIKQKAIFYAVSEKSGIQFAGANGGANNFFDALRQTNYELHKNNNEKLTKNGEKPLQRFEKIVKEFDQKPKQIRPGVGSMIISGYAFSFISDAILNSWTNFVRDWSLGRQTKVFDQWISDNTTGQAFAGIPGILEVYPNPHEYEGYARTTHTIKKNEPGFKESLTWLGGYYKTGTESYQINWAGDEYANWSSPKGWLSKFVVSTKGQYYKDEMKLETGHETVYLYKENYDKVRKGQLPVIALEEPRDMGTLTTPSWDKGSETVMPDYVELEVPITEDGEVDLDRQLSPDNPAKNNPKKPLAPVQIPDYTVPEEGSDKKPVPTPNLTPKPNPQTDPLPSPSPMPEPSPTPDPSVPPVEDSPTTKPGDTQNRWAALVTNKFPFSLPWDIGNMIEPLLAEPVRPSVKVDVSFDVFGKDVPIKFSHNFAWMDDFIGFVRIFILIGFNLFMITGTRKLMGGGQ